MGVPIEDPTNTFVDKTSVVTNLTTPESTLQKRHNAIAYHKCCKEIAAGAARVAFEKGAHNCSNGLTKILSHWSGLPSICYACSLLIPQITYVLHVCTSLYGYIFTCVCGQMQCNHHWGLRLREQLRASL
jgi:hypothetical protein